MSRQQRALIAAVLVLVGIVALVVGVIYLTTAAKSLPSILGTLHGVAAHRSRRGVGALVIGGVLLLAGAVVWYLPRGRRYR